MTHPDGDIRGTRRGAGAFDGTRRTRPNHQSLKEMASDYIRDGVVSGRLGPGAKVDQDEIAEALGISRLPIREALIELTAKGFVESIPRRGAFVVKLEPQDIEDHFEVISLLFGLTAKRAATHISDEQLNRLRQIHQESTTTQDPAARLQSTYAFYQLLNRVATSERLLLNIRFLAYALPNDFYFSTTRWPATETVYRERILDALDHRDSDEALRVTDEHMRTAAKVTIEELRARGYWDEPEVAAEAAS